MMDDDTPGELLDTAVDIAIWSDTPSTVRGWLIFGACAAVIVGGAYYCLANQHEILPELSDSGAEAKSFREGVCATRPHEVRSVTYQGSNYKVTCP